MMESTEHSQNEAQMIPCEEVCPRHGLRVRLYHACSKCVIEEVRRHERRIDAALEREEPIAADSYDEANALMAEVTQEISW
jgi:hypothetical protein